MIHMTATKGFTLLELLVAIVLTAAIVIYLTQLYKMTGHTVTALKSVGSDWNAEQFIRQQLWYELAEFNGELRQFKGEPDRLQFATRYSAAQGDSGTYVKAVYRYNSATETLQYQEQPYLEWWTSSGRQTIKTQALPSNIQPMTVFKQIKNLQFSYSYRDANGLIQWKETWDTPEPPALIRLRYLRGGKLQTFIFDHQVLSFSTASGF